MTSVIIHIGIQRTGSTFLQHNIFPQLKDVNLVNYHLNKGLKSDILGRKDIQVILSNIENYNRDIVTKKIIRRFETNKINLISNENIYCNMWTKEDNRFKKIEKIKDFFPNAKIIIGTRDEKDLLLSWYKKYIVNGGNKDFNNFLAEVINVEKLRYEKYLQHLIELYDRKNIYVYQFNEMKNDITSFIGELCDFMDVQIQNFKNKKLNIGYSLWQLKFSKIINNIFKTPLNPNGIIPLKYNWHPHRIVFQSPLFPKQLRGKKVTLKNLNKES
jgi:hypothetical protein